MTNIDSITIRVSYIQRGCAIYRHGFDSYKTLANYNWLQPNTICRLTVSNLITCGGNLIINSI